MLVLGLDPGLATTGYGLVQGDGERLKAIAYGVLRTSSRLSLAARLVDLHRKTCALLEQFHPHVVAIEELFFATNAQTAMLVGEARGVLLFTVAQAGLEIREYTPLQVKQAVTGYGAADKTQVQHMVKLLLGLDELPRPDDAADALAVSICHHHAARLAPLLES